MPGPKYGLFLPDPDRHTPVISEPDRTPAYPRGPDRAEQRDRTRQRMASMAVNELGPMLTATEVADMLHLHVNTVKRLIDCGRTTAQSFTVSPGLCALWATTMRQQ